MYRAPIKDLLFVMEQVLDMSRLWGLPRYAEHSSDIAEAILTEAGRFASDVLEPINAPGDREGAQLRPDGVALPAGFRGAYQQYVAAGWPQLGIEVELGGQGAPLVVAAAVEEIWFGANMAFMLCPMLSRGAIDALHFAGSKRLQEQYLPRLVSGEWTGTMNLTESQAGSDLAAIRTRAVPEGDHYRVFGQKIFITYGEHDLADNIVHLVLARIEGAPAGVRGISLFVVPRFIDDPNGHRMANDVQCVSIEHKLGIHASPTCVMSYGEHAGALGFLVGEAHHGLEYMFVMMNTARLGVGVQGVGMTERALQQAVQWARTRVQGRPVGAATGTAQPIAYHPDVRRMLLTVRAGVEAMRALALYAALQLDLARALAAGDERAAAQGRADLLIPIVKGWCTDWANELVSLCLQVHGGMGYIEETGIAQTLRDVRITAIYEGTTGIQANDLIGRKLARDGGHCMRMLIDQAQQELAPLQVTAMPAGEVAVAASAALDLLRAATDAVLAAVAATPATAYAVAVPYLNLAGITLGGWLTARAAGAATRLLEASAPDAGFLRGKLQTARFYADYLLPQTAALAHIIVQGGASVASADPDLF